MKVINFPRYRLEIKKDSELTYQEAQEIVDLYNMAFYENQVVDKAQLGFFLRCVRDMDIFYWFLIKNSKDKILAMVSLVHNFTNAYLFDINTELNENICSLAVHPDHRGQGLARQLVKRVVIYAHDYCGLRPNDQLVLELKKDSHHYQQLGYLYTTEGFQPFTQTATGMFFRRS